MTGNKQCDPPQEQTQHRQKMVDESESLEEKSWRRAVNVNPGWDLYKEERKRFTVYRIKQLWIRAAFMAVGFAICAIVGAVTGCASLDRHVGAHIGPVVSHTSGEANASLGVRIAAFQENDTWLEPGGILDTGVYFTEVGDDADLVMVPISAMLAARAKIEGTKFQPYVAAGPSLLFASGDESDASIGADLRIGVSYPVGSGWSSFFEYRATYNSTVVWEDTLLFAPGVSRKQNNGASFLPEFVSGGQNGHGDDRDHDKRPPPEFAVPRNIQHELEAGWESHILIGAMYKF